MIAGVSSPVETPDSMLRSTKNISGYIVGTDEHVLTLDSSDAHSYPLIVQLDDRFAPPHEEREEGDQEANYTEDHPP